MGQHQLAFTNFRQTTDADAVVATLNGFDIQGRKLCEYKKVLQAGEKERIEREKAIRRLRSMQTEGLNKEAYESARISHRARPCRIVRIQGSCLAPYYRSGATRAACISLAFSSPSTRLPR